MTQHIDQPRHRRIETDEYRDFSGNGFGRPMTNGQGTPPAGLGRPQHHGVPQFAPTFQNFGAPQQHQSPQYGIPQQFAPTWSQYPVAPQQPHIPAQRSHPTPPQSNGLATAGLVVAIIGAVFSFIPLVGTVAWVLAPIGLVLSVVGLVKSRSARSGRGKSVAGIMLSVIALIMCVLWTTAFVASAGNVSAQAATVHQVTYKVTTSKGSKITATYSQSRNDQIAQATVSGEASPWSADAQVSGLIGPTVTASISPDLTHVNKKDTISCTIIEDGVQVAQNSATGTDAMVTCTK
ncbi:DUF4190 domain-containing protein [Actinomycetospora sp. TBRC 11914]|uniref:DUF4190 domain-containing protein n=1 Tax=Actinomycetospora sp. TBRC 11914 TaxID=2729387 RepID=UPI00145CD199|nr:DUF4190 domain-containing protein [Actinomycetospora sp. TBRC 11914]NMO91818.1 hypothetical protein [Actinomycetospora sp. TBRC 11914]